MEASFVEWCILPIDCTTYCMGYNSVGNGWVLMVKFPLELPFQVDSSPTTYSVACPVLLFGFHTLTWRRTCEKLLWKIGSLYSVNQKLTSYFPCTPPKKKTFFPGSWVMFSPEKKRCGVGIFPQELSETLASGCPEASCLSTFSDCLIRVYDECYSITHKS